MKQITVLITVITFYLTQVYCFFDIEKTSLQTMIELPENFTMFAKDMAVGLPAKTFTIVTGNSTNIRSQDMCRLLRDLNIHDIAAISLSLKTNETMEKFYEHVKEALDTSDQRISLLFCGPEESESVLKELTQRNLIHRSILYIFFWQFGHWSESFQAGIREAMRVAVVTNPRNGVYRVYYNQATANSQVLQLVNWWSGRLYKSPVLPPAEKIYCDFQGRIFKVPVFHAPPWHFVQYKNDTSINVTGGRDDKLLSLMAKTLNFRYRYYDPPDRSQGSSISSNGTFRGTLGEIWKRNADFFLGDVSITWERLQAVEFSFMTLADSGAFLTHAPSKLSETLAIVRPFRWEVWPFVCVTLLLTGPALWLVIAAPYLWRKKYSNQLTLFNDCCWFTTTLFLRQSSSKEPSSTHKARLVSVLISLGATYVITDMYSANLTSLIAKPAREQPIGTLQALEEAMRDRGYELVVEEHSSSLTILENGTGIYGRLAKLMRRQSKQLVGSVEEGVRMVVARKKVAVLGGRETLYYDTERFGSHNFHLSEKLYTRYSAIALQIGCPYLEAFNRVVMTLFEAGILAKMTMDEYKKLPEQARRSYPVTESDKHTSDVARDSPAPPQQPDQTTKGLQPVSLRMLRGAFCLLGIGYFLSGFSLLFEVQINRRRQAKSESQPAKRPRGKKLATRAIRVMRRRFRRVIVAAHRQIDRALAPD